MQKMKKKIKDIPTSDMTKACLQNFKVKKCEKCPLHRFDEERQKLQFCYRTIRIWHETSIKEMKANKVDEEVIQKEIDEQKELEENEIEWEQP